MQWAGIRGGAREVVHYGEADFSITVVNIEREGQKRRGFAYALGAELEDRVVRVGIEFLQTLNGKREFFITHDLDSGEAVSESDVYHTSAKVYQQQRGRDPIRTFLSDRPILTQIAQRGDVQKTVRDTAKATIEALSSMRFLDLSPDAMRRPSLPGQTILSDRGENLASVLLSMYQDENLREAMLEWIRALTPMDVHDLDFAEDATGRVILQLMEANGHKTSVYSASDGTLRLLGLIAALLSPHAARFYFIEELEVGIHPARLHLLVDLIEQQTRRKERPIQVIATTHSPSLLRLLSEQTLNDALLIYRPEGGASEVVKIVDVPGIQDHLDDVGQLHESEWFENIMAFSGDGAAASVETPEL